MNRESRISQPASRFRSSARLPWRGLNRAAAVLSLLTLAQACNCEDDIRVIPGELEGVICHPDNGQPIGQTPVAVVDARGDTVVETTSDAFGLWSVDRIPPGTVTIVVVIDGLERTLEAQVEPGEVTAVLDEQCRPAPPPPPPPLGSVDGCVCEDDIGWLEGANVYVTIDNGPLLVTATDVDGCFVLEDVPAGAHTLQVSEGLDFTREYAIVVEADTVTSVESPDTCEPPVGEPEPTPDPPVEVGNIQGRVCTPDGVTWLSGAEVYVELVGGGRVDALTDADGNYLVEDAPAGLQTVRVRKGSFESSFDVTVPAGDTVVIPDAECIIEQNVSIAVVDGQWDDVRSVLVNVGIDDAQIVDIAADGAGALLADYASLTQYDIIFFNCGLVEASYLNAPVHAQNLRAFVEAGGSVYASDQAYDVVERAFPEYIDFHLDDTAVDAAQRGATMDSVMANVTDLGLATALALNTIELHYPLGAWSVMEAVSDDVRVYIRGDAKVYLGVTGFFTETLNNVPHTVGFEVGEGNVVYTSFHQEPGINATMERVLQILVFEL